MFIETRILGKPSTAVFYGTNVRLFAGVNAYVVLVIRRAGERFAAHWLRALVRPFTSVRPYVNLVNVKFSSLKLAIYLEILKYLNRHLRVASLPYLSNVTRGKGSTATVERTYERTFPSMSPHVFQ